MNHLSNINSKPPRAIRLPELCSILGVSRATVWRWLKADLDFPQPFHLSAAVTVWDEGEVVAWLESRKAQRGAA